MRPSTDPQIVALLGCLAHLESRARRDRSARGPAPWVEDARAALLDEIGRLAMADGLAIERQGNTLVAVSMVG